MQQRANLKKPTRAKKQAGALFHVVPETVKQTRLQEVAEVIAVLLAFVAIHAASEVWAYPCQTGESSLDGTAVPSASCLLLPLPHASSPSHCRHGKLPGPQEGRWQARDEG